MKKALLLAASLLAALALLWLLERRETVVKDSAPSSALSSVEASSHESLAPLENESGQRARGSVPAEDAPVDSSVTSAAPAGADRAGKVQGRAVFARTQTTVGGGDARLGFTLPSDASDPNELSPGSRGGRKASARIGDDGRFAFDLPSGSHLRWIEISPSSPFLRNPSAASDATNFFEAREQLLDKEVGDAVIEITVEVEGGSELKGLVRDAETLAPLAGAHVSTGETMRYPSHAESGRDGAFVLGGLLPKPGTRKQSLHVVCRDYLARRVPLEAQGIATGAPTLVIEMQRGLAVAGLIVDEQHRPVPGVPVRLLAVGCEPGVDPGASVLSERSDARGHFRCAAVPPCSSLYVDIDALWRDGRDFLALHQDLGPLRANCDELQIELQASGKLELRAQLADGTPLGPREFEVVCVNSTCVEPAGYGPEGLILRIPRGVDLELEAYASAKDEQDPELFVRGKQYARVETSAAPPPVVKVVLSERGGFKVPLPHIGTVELVLPGEDYLHAAGDVHLLDASSGRALENDRCVSIWRSGARVMSGTCRDGWLRIRGRPGRHLFELEIEGGPRELMELVIPASGYGTAEWRLKVAP